MWFDARRALTQIENQGPHEAKTASPAKQDASLADLANLAEPERQNSDIALTAAADDALDIYEERAAIREYDGGQPRAEAETAALAEVAQASGVTPGTLRRLWAKHPDAVAYLAHLSATGPKTCDDAASALHWSRGRAWQAAARLRAAGLVGLDVEGRAEMRRKDTSS